METVLVLLKWLSGLFLGAVGFVLVAGYLARRRWRAEAVARSLETGIPHRACWDCAHQRGLGLFELARCHHPGVVSEQRRWDPVLGSFHTERSYGTGDRKAPSCSVMRMDKHSNYYDRMMCQSVGRYWTPRQPWLVRWKRKCSKLLQKES